MVSFRKFDGKGMLASGTYKSFVLRNLLGGKSLQKGTGRNVRGNREDGCRKEKRRRIGTGPGVYMGFGKTGAIGPFTYLVCFVARQRMKNGDAKAAS